MRTALTSQFFRPKKKSLVSDSRFQNENHRYTDWSKLPNNKTFITIFYREKTTMKTTNTILTLFLLHPQISTVGAFLVPMTGRTVKVSLLNSEKPTRIDLEKAAGQSTLAKNGGEQAAMSGCVTKTPGECCSYASFVQNNDELTKEMERLVEKRPYPLFLMEKAAKYLVDDVLHPPNHSREAQLPQEKGTTKKEKLVILGAGWGSAAVLQGIDNSRYDVTVISPRNYFLFTPMLAGASVGTVNVRSITQPIRDVSTLVFLRSNSIQSKAHNSI